MVSVGVGLCACACVCVCVCVCGWGGVHIHQSIIMAASLTRTDLSSPTTDLPSSSLALYFSLMESRDSSSSACVCVCVCVQRGVWVVGGRVA